MTKPPAETPTPPDDGKAEIVQTEAQVREGVLSQRRHIEELDGEDPLRGGIAD